MSPPRPPKIPVGIVGILILVAVLVAAAFSMWFTVQPEEVGVVLTFGKYAREAPPGLRFKWPWPIQQVVKVPVQVQLKEEFGFRTERTARRSDFGRVTEESLMLTGDLNVAEVEWITQFRVADPYAYLFKVRNIGDTFRDMNEAVMREVVGDRSVNEVLTIGREEIASQVEQRLQELCNQYETGLEIDQIVLQDVNPPDKVKPAFNEVNQAQQERERMINEAQTEYNRVIPRAQGEAQQTIQQAEGYATDRVNRAKGDAEAFKALLAAYKRSPDVTRRRIYLETMNSIYPKVQDKIVLDDDLKGVLPLLPLGSGGGK
ncbi:membrane protein [Acidobacteria bacterium Mor1]|nr:membrane protein [Acidobacteria bacterium Mor1]